MGNIALGREIAVFICEETTLGEMVSPTDATAANANYITPITAPAFTQERETFDDAQIRDTRSRLTPIAGRYLAGAWNFDTYIKPSGTAGTAPGEDMLCKALMGQKDVSSSSMVVYRPSSTTPSLTIWLKEGHTVQCITGATVNQAVYRIEGRNPGTISWSGGCLRRIWTGTADLDATVATADTTITVGAGQTDRFSFHDASHGYSIIKIDSEAMKVDAILSSTKLKVTRAQKGTTATGHNLGSLKVSPWWPTLPTEVGSSVHGRLGFCQFKGASDATAVNYNTLTNEVTITNNVKYYEEEKTGEDWPSEFGTPTAREVTARTTVYFRQGDAQRLAEAKDFDTLKYYVPCGNTAGAICELKMENVKIKAPNTTGDEERIQEIDILPFASSTTANDEIVIIYR